MSSSLGGYGGFSSTRDNTGGGIGGKSTGDIIPKGYRTAQLQQFTPEQLELFQQLFSHVGPDSFLSKLAGGDQSAFEEMEAPAHRQFQGEIGQLASRFSGLGTGSRRSSGFQNTATAAASNFAQDLASKRNDYRQQAINDLMGLSNSLLGQRPYEKALVEKPQQKQGSGFGGLIGSGLGGVGGFFSGGPAGALAGAQLGHSVGSAF